MQNKIKVGKFTIGWDEPLTLIAGPCVIEDYDMTYRIASELKEITDKIGLNFVFKASYDKANRSTHNAYRGPGLSAGLEILAKIKSKLDIAVTSDIHNADEAQLAAEILDIIQIPALLCRQTDLILAASKTGRPVNVKKGQFLAPWHVSDIVDKIISDDNAQGVLLTERGTSFGYDNLVVDFRAVAIMRRMGYPVIFDASHSGKVSSRCKLINECDCDHHTSYQKELCGILAMAAAGAGVDGLFIEVHPNPKQARCDGDTSLDIETLEPLLMRMNLMNALRVIREEPLWKGL